MAFVESWVGHTERSACFGYCTSCVSCISQTLPSPHCSGAVGGLHLLPIYPSSGDSGFAPVTYQEVGPEVGTWDDIAKLARKYDLCLEFMVNHISPASDYFQDFLEKGDKSSAADMFVDWDKFWGPGRWRTYGVAEPLQLKYALLEHGNP